MIEWLTIPDRLKELCSRATEPIRINLTACVLRLVESGQPIEFSVWGITDSEDLYHFKVVSSYVADIVL